MRDRTGEVGGVEGRMQEDRRCTKRRLWVRQQ